MIENQQQYTTFKDFYPYYLTEHKNQTSRRLHAIGSLLVILVLLYAVYYRQWMLLFLLPVIGYGFAWVGHFFFEKNKPATFQYPIF